MSRLHDRNVIFTVGLLHENIEKIHFKKYRQKVTIDRGTFLPKMAKNKKIWSGLKI
jgi:hypothetical protein